MIFCHTVFPLPFLNALDCASLKTKQHAPGMPITQDPKTQPQRYPARMRPLKLPSASNTVSSNTGQISRFPSKRIDKSCRRQYLSRKIRFFKPKGYGSLPSSGTYMQKRPVCFQRSKRRLIFFILQPGFSSAMFCIFLSLSQND